MKKTSNVLPAAVNDLGSTFHLDFLARWKGDAVQLGLARLLPDDLVRGQIMWGGLKKQRLQRNRAFPFTLVFFF